MTNLIDGDQIRGATITDSNLTTSGVTPAIYGSTTEGVQIAVSITGRITSAANVPISGVTGAPHNMLSVTHADTTAASGVVGDMITFNVDWTRLPGNTTTTRKFLEQSGNGTNATVPVWTQVLDTDISTTDTTTNNATTAKHGFLLKLDGVTTHFLSGMGSWTTAGGGSSAIYPNAATMWGDESTLASGNALVPNHDGSQNYSTFSEQASPANGDAWYWNFFLATGTYDIHFLGLTGNSYGKVDWEIDGNSIITGQDWYSASLVHNVFKSTTSISVSTDGTHTLQGTVNGKNGSSSNYYIDITKIWIVVHPPA